MVWRKGRVNVKVRKGVRNEAETVSFEGSWFKKNPTSDNIKTSSSLNSSVTTKGEGVVSLPVCPARGSSFVVQVSPAT